MKIGNINISWQLGIILLLGLILFTMMWGAFVTLIAQVFFFDHYYMALVIVSTLVSIFVNVGISLYRRDNNVE